MWWNWRQYGRYFIILGTVINNKAPEIATGSRDGTVKVWDTRQKDRPVAIIAPAKGEVTRDTWAVAFGNSYNDEERVVAAGYENGDVRNSTLTKKT